MSCTTDLRRSVPCVAIVVAMLLASGCYVNKVTEGAAPAMRVRQDAAPDVGIRMNTVGIIDDSLQSWSGSASESRGKIAVESTNSRRTPTGTLEVYAVLRNRTDQPLQIEGRAMFFDADQLEAEKPTAWTRLQIPPNSTATYRTSSLNQTGIAYYYVELREGR